MKTDKQDARRREIEQAAYELLKEKGYRATSMLAIAKRASASNETLYKWYSNKQTLFRTLVEQNAKEVKKLLQQSLDNDLEALETIQQLGPMLLELVTGHKAIALNRAAVGDVYETKTLGEAIVTAGRNTVAPMVQRVFQKAQKAGLIRANGEDNIAEIYLRLLIGDLQIRRVIGVIKPLTSNEINQRSERAFQLTMKLFGV